MARSTGRPVRFFNLEDGRNMTLSSEMLALTGRAANGSDQGEWVVTETTKVAAAARMSALIGRVFRPQQFHEATGNSAQAILRAGLLRRAGDVVAWRRSGADQPVLRLAAGEPAATDGCIAAHWRMDGRNLALVLVERDVSLMDVTPVPVSPEVGREAVSAHYGGTKILYAGGVGTYALYDGEVWVPALGRISADKARELMSGLAGALAELDARVQA